MKATSRQMRDRSGRGAFTLLEMLTVVVIVGLLLAIGVPSILQMQKHAIEKTSKVTINTLDGACRMYSKNYRERFPPSNRMPWDTADRTNIGRYCLAEALTGYAPAAQDGVESWGYRTSSGRIQVPLVDVNRMRITNVSSLEAVFRDGFENEIWYYCEKDVWYRYRTGDTPTLPTEGPFDANHNNSSDIDPNLYVENLSGQTPKYLTMDILICSRGADAIWGSRDHKTGTVQKYYKNYRNIDDLTNFLGE